MSRQSWSAEEDGAISALVDEFGIEDWTKIALRLKDRLGTQRRTGKQCRQRWYNHLSPTVNKLPWTGEEEERLFVHHQHYGNRWKDISKLFVGRTDNDIKNHFYSTLRRSLRRLNKIIGEKNSTTQMREIKPSVLSTIMNYIYSHGRHFDHDLKDIPLLIFQYAKFKPIKGNLKEANVDAIREKTGEIFALIGRLTQQYENEKAVKSQRRRKESKEGSEKTQAMPVKQEEDREEFEEEKGGVSFEPEQVKIEEEVELKFCKQEEPFASYQRTEFTLNPQPQPAHHYPLSIFHHTASPKPTYDLPATPPALHRTFSLQADADDLHFQEPEEPSHEEEYSEEEAESGEAGEEPGSVSNSFVDEILSPHL